MATVMELMRELKHLGELRKSGQISPEQDQRLKEIRAVLDSQMGKSGATLKPVGPTPRAAPVERGTFNPDEEIRPGNPNAFMMDMPEDLAGDLAASAAKADAAMKATKTRPRARNSDEAVEQLESINQGNRYTPPEFSLSTDEYFGYGDGYEAAVDAPVDLPLIDPRTAELHKLGESLAADGVATLIMPGGVFLDDFMELYTNKILLADETFGEDDADADDPTLLIPGKRKVTVHMVNGEVKRGVITRMSRADQGFTLLPVGAGKSEQISLQSVKAVFVTLNPGATMPVGAGRSVTVTFKDRRSIQGATSDYGAGPSFTLIPPPGRGGIEKIIVNSSQCQDVR